MPVKTQDQMIYRDKHGGLSFCERYLIHLLLLPFLPFVQRALPLGHGAQLQTVGVGSSLQGLAAAADMEIVGMLHRQLKEVLQHKQSQIADILRDLGRLEGEVVLVVLVLAAAGFCSGRMARQQDAGRP